jgi:hypothetical protein
VLYYARFRQAWAAFVAQDNQEESHVSDQDFFFEDDAKPAEKSDNKAKKATPASGSANKGGTRPAASPTGGGDGQSVTMTMAIMFAVIGLLLGVVIGLFIGNMVSPPAAATVTSPSTQVAPVLTDEQMNAGQLPAGHPAVTASGTPAPSTTATKTK